MKLQKLEAVRGFAAVYVAIGHWILINVQNPLIRLPFRFGQEAVICFFLISGFVIYYSYQRNQSQTFKNYFFKRFNRIYFPVFSAFALSGILQLFKQGEIRFTYFELIGNVLMLQDFSTAKPGNWVDPFLGNTPLWSLSYEWWFYMLFFPFIRFLNKPQSNDWLVFSISTVAWIFYVFFPNHAMLVISHFIIWWAGVRLCIIYLLNKTINFSLCRILFIQLGMMLMLSIVPFFIHKQNQSLQFGIYPVLTLRYFFATLLFVFIGISWYKVKWIGFKSLLGSFSKIAPISYGIYVLHYPILHGFKFFAFGIWGDLVIKSILVVFLAYLVEIKLQPIFNRLVETLFKKDDARSLS